jgi:hypothetical protein|tara:strand:- start:183 stop:362 length:180 start_codon:yes stop_codon:yes gene_type:complete
MYSELLQSEAVDCIHYNLLEKTMRKYDYQQIRFALSTFVTVAAIHLLAPAVMILTAGTI